jgi:hypothetical protein
MIEAKIYGQLKTVRDKFIYASLLLPVNALLDFLPYFQVETIEPAGESVYHPKFKGLENAKGMHALMKVAFDDAFEYRDDLKSQGVADFEANSVLPLGRMVRVEGVFRTSRTSEMNCDRYPHLLEILEVIRGACLTYERTQAIP